MDYDIILTTYVDAAP